MKLYYFVLPFLFLTGSLIAQEKEVIMEKLENNSSADRKDNLAFTADTVNRSDEFFVMASRFDVEKTVSRLKQHLKAREIPVFALFDHGENARKVGLDLRPTQVLVFGSPMVGTALMQENQLIALELPLKIAVWEDKDGKVWAGFLQMEKLARQYGLQHHPVIAKMQVLLEDLVRQSV